jgi:dCTP deaminase
MILGREKLLARIKEGIIEGYDPSCLGGAGYDLRIGRLYFLKSGGFLGVEARKTPDIEEFPGEEYCLLSGEYALAETIEKVNMPDDLVARILNRSTVFRCGCTLATALVDPGFHGTLTLGIKNLSSQEFRLERGARIAQIVFEEIVGETLQYSGKYQGGKVV